MKVRDERVVHHSGTIVPQETIAMGIDQKSLAHIMQVLTDLYSDPSMAVIREYSTNAYDSHRAAGITDPIEVELPSGLRPTFVVRDHGVGMSHDQIKNQFSQYGFSSKRDSNDEVGILGLGCKSGLTYTSQFTLVSIKNGMKITVLITKNDHGVGVLQVLDTVSTDEPNGVEIQIPVSNPAEFVKKANYFYSFWEKGTVLVNGVEPTCIFEHEDALVLDPDVIVIGKVGAYRNDRYGTEGVESDIVVMGNIPYPCATSLSRGATGTYHHVVARIEVGEIDFTPSRESLYNSKHTEATLLSINKFVKENLFRHAQTEVDSQPTRWEGARAAIRWSGVIAGNKAILTYHGERIPMTIPLEGWEWSQNSYQKKCSKASRISIETAMAPGTILVRNHPTRSMDATLKEALQEKYGAKMKIVIAVCPDTIKPEYEDWILGTPQEEYSVIRPRKIRQKREPGSAPPVEMFKWMVRKGGQFIETSEDLSPTAKFVYILRSDPDASSGSSYTRESYRNVIGQFIDKMNVYDGNDFEFAVVRKPELEKFLKKHPEAQTFYQFVTSALAAIDQQFTEDARSWGVTPHDLRTFNADDILDPKVATLIRRIQLCMDDKTVTLHKQRKEIKSTAWQIARITLPELTGKSDIIEQVEQWRANYPLAGVSMLTRKSECIEYFNALFTYRNERNSNAV